MKTKKSLMLLLPLLALGLVGCNENSNPEDNSDSQIRAVYRSYQENGGTLTYEDWLASIKGEPGEDGRGIVSISKASSVGNVDTYVIVYSDGTTSSFTVTNGIDGQSIKGESGENGHTPVVTIGENGNWYIDGIDSGKTAKGTAGNDGSDGASAYELYCKYHPDYKGTEEEWVSEFYSKEEYDYSNYSNLVFEETTYKGESCYFVTGTILETETVVIPETFKGIPVRGVNLIGAGISSEYVEEHLTFVLSENVKVVNCYSDATFIFRGSLDYVCMLSEDVYFLGSLDEYNETNLEEFFNTRDIYCWNENTKEYEIAIRRARNVDGLLDLTFSNGLTNASRFIDEGMHIEQHDFISLASRYFFGGDTVTIEWEYDKKIVTEVTYYDDNVGCDVIELHPIYPESNEAATQLNLKVKKITADIVEFSYEELVNKYPLEVFEYLITLNPRIAHKAMTIKEIYSVSTDSITRFNQHYPSTFNVVDYTQMRPNFKSYPEGQNYCYVKVKGKIIYVANDQSFALLADGDDIIELYAGTSYRLHENIFPALSNEYVEVYGQLSQYQGNIQLSFIYDIVACDKNDITEPTMNYGKIDEAFLLNLKTTYGGLNCELQAVEGLPNSLKQVTGSYVPGSLMDHYGKEISLKNIFNYSSSRFTFKVAVGSCSITIAYDYHTDNSIIRKVYDAISAGTEITVKGTMRYENDCSEPFILENSNAHWTLVPFLEDHISFVEK